jgi:Co/Zn/Cd efflux system component
MSKECCGVNPSVNGENNHIYRKVLWFALALNMLMFVIELYSGLRAGSTSLLADSLDFLGDTVNYGISLFVLNMVLIYRARASLLKGLSMAAFGIWVLVEAIDHVFTGVVPNAPVMGAIGFAALTANIAVALALYRYRKGDSNMRSVWLCSRNDALGNMAVMLAALGVFGTESGWPDILVAVIMAGLALSSAIQVVHHALQEIRTSSKQAF